MNQEHRQSVTGPVHEIRMCAPATLTPYAGNARTHSPRQIRQIADSITRFGFTNPVLVDGEGSIVAGHGRVAAAKLLGMAEVPTLSLAHLGPAERRAYILADNKLAENAGWDRDLLAIELQGLIEIGFDLELTGFSLAEIDFTLDAARGRQPDTPEREDRLPAPATGPAVTRPGDLWALGAHRLLCGDARAAADLDRLMAGVPADLIFTDPPYNVPIDGHVTGLGRIADALRDCSRRGEVVLDLFAGSGSTLIAAESCGRAARLLELDPHYCDTILRRWQAYSGKGARRESDGLTFDAAAIEATGLEAR